jgi:hypothetical protein
MSHSISQEVLKSSGTIRIRCDAIYHFQAIDDIDKANFKFFEIDINVLTLSGRAEAELPVMS